jgi:hypothetical protein
MATIKIDRVIKESFEDYSKFTARVSELNGSIQPGAKEIALESTGKVIGSFDKAMNLGKIYPTQKFESVEEMEDFNDTPKAVVEDVDLGDVDEEKLEAVEETLKAYEESAKTGKDYMALVESLTGKKVGLQEAVVAKVVSTFDTRALSECVRAFDTKLGKYVRAFKESVDCDNFIAETGVDKRFTKRFFN